MDNELIEKEQHIEQITTSLLNKLLRSYSMSDKSRQRLKSRFNIAINACYNSITKSKKSTIFDKLNIVDMNREFKIGDIVVHVLNNDIEMIIIGFSEDDNKSPICRYFNKNTKKFEVEIFNSFELEAEIDED